MTLVAVGKARFRAMVLRIGDALPGLRDLRIRKIDGGAVVRALLVFASAGNGPAALAPRSFIMQTDGGAWKLRSIEYLAQSYAAALASDEHHGDPASARSGARSIPTQQTTTTNAP